MAPRSTTRATVEACGACEGLWIEWFDGEIATVAAELEAARVAQGSAPPRRSSPLRSGSGACPRCMRALGAEIYCFADVSPRELVVGVELLRCPECAGAFVPRGSAHLLLERIRETRTQTPLEALRALVRQLFARARG